MTRKFFPKYIIKGKMFCEGIVEKSDIIGAIFGQFDGLLPESLNLQQLQETGKIDRMQVDVSHENGKTKAWIKIPTSLSKNKLAVLAASLERVDRVGPSETETIVTEIQDTMEKKRKEIIERASEILEKWDQLVTPKRLNLLSKVKKRARHQEIITIGDTALPAAPRIHESHEIIVVEGRADVLNLLRFGYDNTVAIQGTNIPETVRDLIDKKVATLFVDGDRSGFLISKEALTTTDLDYLARAPKGSEVQDLNLKEVKNALARKIPVKSLKIDVEKALTFKDIAPKDFFKKERKERRGGEKFERIRGVYDPELKKKLFSNLRENLLDEEKFAIYKYPKDHSSLEMIRGGQLSELEETIKALKSNKEKILLVDDTITQKLVNMCVPANFKVIVGKSIGDLVKQPFSIRIAVPRTS